MVVTIDAELEAALKKQAHHQGMAPEALALNVLRERLLVGALPEARDEWERKLLEAGTKCGVALSHEAVSSEGLYD